MEKLLFTLVFSFLFICNVKSIETFNAPYQVPNPKTNSDSFISDPNDYLSVADETEINGLIREIRDEKGFEIAVVVVSSINQQEPLPFATDLINNWGVGKGDRGILLLVAVKDRNMAFATGYATEEFIPDLLTKKISEEEMLPYFKLDDYAKGIKSGVHTIRNILLNDNVPEYAEELVELSKKIKIWKLFALIATILIVALTIYVSPTGKTLLTVVIIAVCCLILAAISYAIFAKEKYPGSFIWTLFTILSCISFIVNAFILLKKETNKIWVFAILITLSVPIPFVGLYLYGYHTLVFVYLIGASIVFGLFLIMYAITFLVPDPYVKYKVLKMFKLDIFTYIFPLPMYIVDLLVEQQLESWRNRPRFSKKTGLEMRKLCEVEDNAFLKATQVSEEKVKSVDYDVWISDDPDDVLILDYVTWFSGYSNCSKCKAKTWYLVYDRTITAATYSSSGTGERKKSCAHCKHQVITTYTIAQLQKSSSSGGSSGGGGGSWGGGSSGGGGSSSSW